MSNRGKFIVIEGTDGSGKTTQFNLLSDKLKRETDKKILVADFPRYYDSIWGKMIGEMLTGKYGKFDQLDPHLTTTLYMVDQYTWCRDVGKEWLDSGGWILSNRYFTSNVHQIAKYRGKKRSELRKWLWPAGYEKLRIIKPDLVLFLDVNPTIALKMNKKKEKRNYLKNRKSDIAESNKKHQIESYKEYLFTVKKNEWWQKVRCTKDGMIDDPDTIHERVWQKVEKLLEL